MKTLYDIAAKIPGHSKCCPVTRHYLGVFEQYLAKHRDKPINFVEIGVGQGGSMQIWKEYFTKAAIYGVDIRPECSRFEDDRVKIIIGDQSDKGFCDDLCRRVGSNIDVLIDDGGHSMKQQVMSFINLWGNIRPGGIYIVEDLHTSYWPSFGGGIGKPYTTIQFIKGLVDNLNAIHTITNDIWNEALLDEVVRLDRHWERCKMSEAVAGINKNLEFVHFYDSLAIIGKKNATRI